jgi:hypothetical protein
MTGVSALDGSRSSEWLVQAHIQQLPHTELSDGVVLGTAQLRMFNIKINSNWKRESSISPPACRSMGDPLRLATTFLNDVVVSTRRQVILGARYDSPECYAWFTWLLARDAVSPYEADHLHLSDATMVECYVAVTTMDQQRVLYNLAHSGPHGAAQVHNVPCRLLVQYDTVWSPIKDMVDLGPSDVPSQLEQDGSLRFPVLKSAIHHNAAIIISCPGMAEFDLGCGLILNFSGPSGLTHHVHIQLGWATAGNPRLQNLVFDASPIPRCILSQCWLGAWRMARMATAVSAVRDAMAAGWDAKGAGVQG